MFRPEAVEEAVGGVILLFYRGSNLRAENPTLAAVQSSR